MEIEVEKPLIYQLLEQGRKDELEEKLESWLPDELAELCNDLNAQEQAVIFSVIDRDQAYQTFEILDLNAQVLLIEVLRYRQLQLILNDMSADNRTALLEQLESEQLNKLLKLLTQKERRVALSLLGYPEDSIGRLMTPDYIVVNQDWTIREVLDYIRRVGEKSETLDVIYIIDDMGYLIDDIKVGDILLAEDEVQIKDLLDGKYTSLLVTDDEEVAVKAFSNTTRVALPVTDAGGLLLGIITVDDVLDLAKKEDTEDIQKLGAVEALQEPYMEVSMGEMLKKRAPWLVVLFVGELFTASAMGFFEHEIAKAVVLALFIPLIVSSGGNSGSQASTLIIRALALGEITVRDWWQIMRKELVTGALLGLILGILGFARVGVWGMFTDIYGPHWPYIGMTIGFSVMFVVLWGTVMGSMMPLLLKHLGADPATSSAPFIATLVDVTGLIIYFSVAALLLTGTLL
ncbi:MAG: magnesium transporter [Bacteroidia bacterium]|jgi:magnesium transporter|nr:magnesium transporter [Bacteroidia bacterium]